MLGYPQLARIIGLAAFLTASASVQAAPIVVTFDNDAPGAKANGFTSVDSALVHFSDSVDADLNLGFAGQVESNGTNGLAVFDDFDNSVLVMDFDVNIGSLSLDFGNDEPFGTILVQDAVLTLFLNGLQVGQSMLAVNNNDQMDQTISFAGAPFNRATFAYVDASGQLATLIEFVDNVTFEVAAVPTPLPGTLALLGLGLVGLGAGQLRRRA